MNTPLLAEVLQPHCAVLCPDACRLLSKRLGKRHLGKKTKGSSQYWGVCKHKRNGGVWVSNVWATVRQVSLGQFEEEEEAALAYDAASYILYGK